MPTITEQLAAAEAAAQAANSELAETGLRETSNVRNHCNGMESQMDNIASSMTYVEDAFTRNDTDAFWADADESAIRTDYVVPLQSTANNLRALADRLDALAVVV